MPEILFGDKNNKPNDDLLLDKIGTGFKYWVEIQKHVKSNYEKVLNEWKFYGKNYGWQLKTLLNKRNLFFSYLLKHLLKSYLYSEIKQLKK